jgi:hypothetical protein
MMDGQSDGVAGAAVDFDHVAAGGFDSQHGVVSVIDHAGDDDVLQFGADFCDHAFQQIVRQRPRRGRGGQPSIDAGRFEDPDQNRKRTFASELAQIDHLLIVDFADDDPRQLHFDEHGGFFPAERVLLATAMACKEARPRRVRKTRVYPRAELEQVARLRGNFPELADVVAHLVAACSEMAGCPTYDGLLTTRGNGWPCLITQLPQPGMTNTEEHHD